MRNFLVHGSMLSLSGPHPLTTESFPKRWGNQEHPHKYPKYPAGGSTAPFENHHLRRQAEPRIPSAWMGPSGTQPCPHSPSRKLSADLPSREVSEEALGHVSWLMGQPPGCTIRDKAASQDNVCRCGYQMPLLASSCCRSHCAHGHSQTRLVHGLPAQDESKLSSASSSL